MTYLVARGDLLLQEQHGEYDFSFIVTSTEIWTTHCPDEVVLRSALSHLVADCQTDKWVLNSDGYVCVACVCRWCMCFCPCGNCVNEVYCFTHAHRSAATTLQQVTGLAVCLWCICCVCVWAWSKNRMSGWNQMVCWSSDTDSLFFLLN